MSLTNTAVGLGLRWAVIPKTLAKMVTFRKSYRSHAAGAAMIVGSIALWWMAPETTDEAMAKVQATAALVGVFTGIAIICLRLGLTGVATFILETVLKELATTQEQIAAVKELTEEAVKQAEAAKTQAVEATVAAQETVPISQVTVIAHEAAEAAVAEVVPTPRLDAKRKPGGSGRM